MDFEVYGKYIDSADSSEEVIKILGEFLENKELAKKGLAKKIIEREREFPTGIDTGDFGVAIPHTDSSWTNKAAINCGVLKKPVFFNEMGGEERKVAVNIVFLLLIDNSELQLKTLKALMGFIQDKKLLKKLKKAKKSNEIEEFTQEGIAKYFE